MAAARLSTKVYLLRRTRFPLTRTNTPKAPTENGVMCGVTPGSRSKDNFRPDRLWLKGNWTHFKIDRTEQQEQLPMSQEPMLSAQTRRQFLPIQQSAARARMPNRFGIFTNRASVFSPRMPQKARRKRFLPGPDGFLRWKKCGEQKARLRSWRARATRRRFARSTANQAVDTESLS